MERPLIDGEESFPAVGEGVKGWAVEAEGFDPNSKTNVGVGVGQASGSRCDGVYTRQVYNGRWRDKLFCRKHFFPPVDPAKGHKS